MTIDDILALTNICARYTREVVTEVFDGHTDVDAAYLVVRMFQMGKPIPDIIWVCSQPQVTPEPFRRGICTELIANLTDDDLDRADVIAAIEDADPIICSKAALRAANCASNGNPATRGIEMARQYDIFNQVIGGI